MYLPSHFAETDLAELDALLQRDAFISLISTDTDGLPFASHLPVLYQRDGDRLTLRGHWARPNPQWCHASPMLAIVHGPHAYVSPTWYSAPEHNVPTWNYAVAHLRGRLRIFHDEIALLALVSELAAKYEQSVGSDWRFPDAAPDKRSALRGIVGFEMTVERIELKFKLNQNHPAANVRGAAAALQAQGGEPAEVAAMMRARLPDDRIPPTA